MSIEDERCEVTGREFLDFAEHNNNRIEELVKLGDNEIEIEIENKQDSHKKPKNTPPWRREPIKFNDDVLRRTQDFLSLCNEVGSRKIVENEDTDRKVVMDVHLGVFDVNGKIPDNQLLSSRDIVDVPIDEFNDMTKYNAEDEYFEDNSDCSSDIDRKIYKMLNNKRENEDLVRVISSSEDK